MKCIFYYKCEYFLFEIAVISGAFCYDVILDSRLNDWKPTKVSAIICPECFVPSILVQWFSGGGRGQWCT